MKKKSDDEHDEEHDNANDDDDERDDDEDETDMMNTKQNDCDGNYHRRFLCVSNWA